MSNPMPSGPSFRGASTRIVPGRQRAHPSPRGRIHVARSRNLRFFDDRARTRYNLIVDRIYGLMSEHSLLDSQLQLVLEHFDDPASSGLKLSPGFSAPSVTRTFHSGINFWCSSPIFFLHEPPVTSCGYPGEEAVVQWATRHVIDHALEHYALFPNTVWYMRDEARRGFYRASGRPQGLQPTDLNPPSPQTSVLPRWLVQDLLEQRGWAAEQVQAFHRRIVNPGFGAARLLVPLDPSVTQQRSQEHSIGNVVLNPQHAEFEFTPSLEAWRSCNSCFAYLHASRVLDGQCPSCGEEVTEVEHDSPLQQPLRTPT